MTMLFQQKSQRNTINGSVGGTYVSIGFRQNDSVDNDSS